MLYVFGKRQLKVDLAAQRLEEYFHDHANELENVKRVVLRHDVVYAHIASA